jgi:hypothetical protein
MDTANVVLDALELGLPTHDEREGHIKIADRVYSLKVIMTDGKELKGIWKSELEFPVFDTRSDNAKVVEHYGEGADEEMPPMIDLERVERLAKMNLYTVGNDDVDVILAVGGALPFEQLFDHGVASVTVIKSDMYQPMVSYRLRGSYLQDHVSVILTDITEDDDEEKSVQCPPSVDNTLLAVAEKKQNTSIIGRVWEFATSAAHVVVAAAILHSAWTGMGKN